MHRPNLSKGKRSIYFIVALTALLGAFFLLLYFNILPSNRERVNRDVFSILRSSAANISAETENYLYLCNEYTKRAIDTQQLRRWSIDTVPNIINDWLKRNKLSHTVQRVPIPGKEKREAEVFSADTFRLTSVRYNSFYFEKQWAEGVRFRYRLALDSFMLRMEMDQQQEFLDQYLLVADADVVFKSAGVSIAKDFVLDSFLKKENRFTSGTTVLSMDETPSRIFYYPFELGGKNMFLCGVVKEADYKAELYRLPDGFIYIMVTLLVLLIITQPILKLPLMSMHEPVRFSGFVLFVGALFTGVSAITLLTVHILMLTGSSVRSEANLRELSAQMKRGFNYEVWRTLKVMDALDVNVGESFAKVNPDSAMIFQKEKELKALLDTMEKRETATETDRVFWISEKGWQEMKVEKGMEGVGNLDVSDRAYFRDVADGRMNMLRFFSPKKFAMEALRNRVNGAFRMVVSKKSLWQGRVMAISTCMGTWCDPLLPLGYGFALVDADGVVQVHEKESKNLKENLFNRLPDPGMLKEVIKGRKTVFRADVHLYGRKVDMLMTPLEGYPYFLVTYYKKDFMMPVVLKILVFTIAHVAIIYLVYILGWLLYFGKRMGTHPRLFAPIHLVGWAIPAEKLWSFYLKGSVFLLVSLVGIITAMACAPKLEHGNALVFTLIMVSPFQVVSGLALVYAWERKVRNVGRWMRWSFFSGHTLLTMNLLLQAGIFILNCVVFCGMVYEWMLVFCLQFFQWIVIVFPLKVLPGKFLFQLVRKQPEKPPLKQKGYRLFYFTYLFLLVLMVGALPPSLLTWMSHNIEIEQQIRKQELNLAERVGERLSRDTTYHALFPIGTLLDAMPREQQAAARPSARRITESYGYFSPTPFRIRLFTGAAPVPAPRITEPHYYALSAKVANRAYDPMFYPVLPDLASGAQWSFDRQRDTVMLWYKPPFPTRNAEGVFVKMETGPRFVYFDMGAAGIALTLFVLIILYLLARVIKYGTFSLFLWKYLAAAGKKGNATSLLARWKEQESFDAFLNTGSPEYRIDDRERAIMKNVDRHRSFFEFLWENCSDKEKFLLFDFALDGLMNYKNSYEITKLVEKGILVPHRRLDILRLFSASFRLFVLTKKNSLQMAEITRKYNRASPLGVFRFVLVVVAVAFFTFIFFTQNDVFDKILALTGGIVSVLANLSRITGAAAEKQAG
ncbi:hypothetical protein [Parasegetibacter sp. NRK P23]|uniref:hypothetical protein n=1 Tax=Parasegetibacter sp. NRK P23 TaxID=2942999 RepID=UPI002043F712|nr:hypothetical protein [Parasegetibacter sp. NRK P23]MCM5527603.1 hypothetical protein [Parasegetibacter sp. NRK P23]